LPAKINFSLLTFKVRGCHKMVGSSGRMTSCLISLYLQVKNEK